MSSQDDAAACRTQIDGFCNSAARILSTPLTRRNTDQQSEAAAEAFEQLCGCMPAPVSQNEPDALRQALATKQRLSALLEPSSESSSSSLLPRWVPLTCELLATFLKAAQRFQLPPPWDLALDALDCIMKLTQVFGAVQKQSLPDAAGAWPAMRAAVQALLESVADVALADWRHRGHLAHTACLICFALAVWETDCREALFCSDQEEVIHPAQ